RRAPSAGERGARDGRARRRRRRRAAAARRAASPLHGLGEGGRVARALGVRVASVLAHRAALGRRAHRGRARGDGRRRAGEQGGGAGLATSLSAYYAQYVHNTRMTSVAILGASGYAGQETLDRVLSHPALELVALGSDSLAGNP